MFYDKTKIQFDNSVKKEPYYLWAYYKINVPDENQCFYIAFGTVKMNNESQEKSHDFIYLGNPTNSLSLKKELPFNYFNENKTDIEFSIDDAIHYLSGNIKHQNKDITWRLSFKRLWSYESKGWIGRIKQITKMHWFPYMADSLVSGKITINSNAYNFINQPAYLDYNWGNTELQYLDQTSYDFINEDRYLFASIEQKTLSITARIDLNVTPELSIQFYGSPFVELNLTTVR